MTLTPRDKRMLQVLGVVGGLAVIYLLFTTVLGGDDGELAAPTGPTGGVIEPSVSPTTSPSPTPRETLPPVNLAGARDPFSIPPGLDTSGSVAPTGTATATTTATATATGTATTPPPTSPPPTSPPPTSPPPTSPPPPGDDDEPATDHIQIGGHNVRLESIAGSGSRLQVRVDGSLYTVEEGALFDENFRLVRINGDCARFLFGDQSFTLCERGATPGAGCAPSLLGDLGSARCRDG